METTNLNTMTPPQLRGVIQEMQTRFRALQQESEAEIDRLNKRCKQYEALYNAAVTRSPEQANKLALRLVNSVENAEV